MSLLAELRRRNVIRMAGLYLVGAWLVTQVSATVLPLFGAPDWIARSVIVMLAIGFVPALVFAWVFELTPQGIKRDADVAPEQSIAPQTAQRMNRMIVAVLVLAVVYFGFDKIVLSSQREAAAVAIDRSERANAIERKSATAEAQDKSIAVLPFVDMSADKDNEYFSDGISEEILNALTQVDDLKVAGRTSSFFFKGKNENLTTIGDRCSTHRHGFDAAWWSCWRSVSSAPVDPLAYDEYLQGRSPLRQRSNLPRAISHFQSAVAKAPEFAAAWSSLSLAHDVIYWYERNDRGKALAAPARAADAAARAAALGTTIGKRMIEHEELAHEVCRRNDAQLPLRLRVGRCCAIRGSRPN